MAMADESRENSSEVKLNFIEIILSDLCEALMETPESEKYLIATLKSMSPKAKKEYLNIKKDFIKKPSKAPSSHHHSSPSPSSRKSLVSRLLLLAKNITSQYNNTTNDFKLIHLVVTTILEALLATHYGKTSFHSCLQGFCQSGYLDLEGATNTDTDTDTRTRKTYDRGTPKDLPPIGDHLTKAQIINSLIWEDLMNKRQGEEVFILRKTIVAEFINSRGNNIDVADLVCSFIWHDLMYKPKGEEHFLSRLKRISSKAIKEYLNLTKVYTSETELNTQDCDPSASRQKASTQAACKSLSSTAKKSNKTKATFGDMCEYFIPCPVLPGGLVLAQSMYCAKVSLSFFNCEHGTNYKLIEPLASAQYMVSGVRFHSNFIVAKPEKNARPKLFYANFRCRNKRVCDVHCCIVNFKKATFACRGECPPVLAHCEKRYTEGRSVDRCIYLSKESKARKNEFCAKAALNFFNEKHGTKYGLVESLDSFIVPINLGTYRLGCRFKAKLEEPSAADADADADADASSPKLFAADLVMSTGWKDGQCYIINTAEDLDDDPILVWATGNSLMLLLELITLRSTLVVSLL
ncbi:uncharacterized protein LOC110725446 [Chenopodium quinoa]|uniref:uncharacterized protein LOC110725446 n=1 Tax=Chenopodium quinoa TaxID=63459 RepID=UPI000B77C072|nr:uncharacterized protein LOC110725446 [Chenopodium quinoa]